MIRSPYLHLYELEKPMKTEFVIEPKDLGTRAIYCCGPLLEYGLNAAKDVLDFTVALGKRDQCGTPIAAFHTCKATQIKINDGGPYSVTVAHDQIKEWVGQGLGKSIYAIVSGNTEVINHLSIVLEGMTTIAPTVTKVGPSGLQAVGQDWDGSYKPLEELSYLPKFPERRRSEMLTPGQRERIKAAARHTYEPLVLDGLVAEVKPITGTMREMEFKHLAVGSPIPLRNRDGKVIGTGTVVAVNAWGIEVSVSVLADQVAAFLDERFRYKSVGDARPRGHGKHGDFVIVDDPHDQKAAIKAKSRMTDIMQHIMGGGNIIDLMNSSVGPKRTGDFPHCQEVRVNGETFYVESRRPIEGPGLREVVRQHCMLSFGDGTLWQSTTEEGPVQVFTWERKSAAADDGTPVEHPPTGDDVDVDADVDRDEAMAMMMDGGPDGPTGPAGPSSEQSWDVVINGEPVTVVGDEGKYAGPPEGFKFSAIMAACLERFKCGSGELVALSDTRFTFKPSKGRPSKG